MKRNRWLILLLLLLMIITVIFGLLFFRDPINLYHLKEAFIFGYHPDPLASELTDAFSKYESGDIPYVDMAAVTTFDWDRLYIYGPYTSPVEELYSRFGRSFMSCSTEITANDGVSLLVFAKGNILVHCMDYGPDVGGYSFTRLHGKYPDGISSQDALFILREDYWIYLLNDK